MFTRIKQLTLLIGDFLALYLALFLGLWLRYLKLPTYHWNILAETITPLFIIMIIILFISGLYDLSIAKNKWSFYQKIVISVVIWFVISLIFFYLNPRTNAQPKTIILLTAFSSIIFISIWRFFHNKYLSKTILKTNLVFAGLSDETKELIEKINQEPEIGYEVIGIIENDNQIIQTYSSDIKNCNIYTSLADINEFTGKNIDLVVISPIMAQNEFLSRELYQRLHLATSAQSLDKFYEQILKRIPPFTFSESWFLTNLDEQNKKIYDRTRIIIDYFFAIIMSIAFAISFIIIAPLIKITSPGPIFFIQKRIGRNGKIFNIIKYRTMISLHSDGSAEKNGAEYAQINDVRITSIGNFLRKIRLDELPQFINIFKGDMSLVGPRPERPEFVTALTEKMPYYQLRHLIKPGLTGWAQIQNSYYGTMEENLRKLEYDLYYLKHRGMLIDVIIILKTFNILGRMAGR